MPFYRQTIGGHFYKDYKNGNSKRVSEKEYLKNIRRVKGGATLLSSIGLPSKQKSNLIQNLTTIKPPEIPLLTASPQNPPSTSQNKNTPLPVSTSSSSLNQPKEKETIKESSLSSQLELPPESSPPQSPLESSPPQSLPPSPLPKENRPVTQNPNPNLIPIQGINKTVQPKGTVITKAVSSQKYTCKCSCKKIGNNNKNKT